MLQASYNLPSESSISCHTLLLSRRSLDVFHFLTLLRKTQETIYKSY